MLKAIWPALANLPNHLPESANITSRGMLCYILYWLIQFPFMFVSPQKIRWLFVAKGIIVPIAWIAMLIWALVKVPSLGTLISQHANVSGSNLSWAWLHALNSALGIYSTLAVNIPDFTVWFVISSFLPLIFDDSFRDTLKQSGRECISLFVPTSADGISGSIVQTEHSAFHNPRCIYLLRLHRNCCHKCWTKSIRRDFVGSSYPHRQMG